MLVGDMQESVFYVAYKAPENRLLVFADDSQPRWVTAQTMVDYTTVAVGDRFGNVFVNRLDMKVSDQVDEDPTGAGILHEKRDTHGAPHKDQNACPFPCWRLNNFYPQDLSRRRSREVLLYTGLHGTIGILVRLFPKKTSISSPAGAAYAFPNN